MGIKKKMTKVFTRKTNSRRDKRKENKKQQQKTNKVNDATAIVKRTASNVNDTTAIVKRTASNETITLVRPFSNASNSSFDSTSNGSSLTSSSTPLPPLEFSDNSCRTVSIYSLSLSSADDSRSILPKTPLKTLQRTFSDVNQNNNEQYSVSRGEFFRPLYDEHDDIVVEEFEDDEVSPTPAYVSGEQCNNQHRPKSVFVPHDLNRRAYKEKRGRDVPRDITTPELPIYFPEYYLTEPDEESTPVTPPMAPRLPPLPHPDSSAMLGRLLRAKTPHDIAYSWKEFAEPKKPIAEKLLLYKTEKESRILQNNPQQFSATATPLLFASRNSSAASRGSTASDKGQTMEDYLYNIKWNKTEWMSRDRINNEEQKKSRRNLLEGSYPIFTVNENKLPKLLRYVWKGKYAKLELYLAKKSTKKKINMQDEFGRTALHLAASWADYRATKMLLEVEGIALNLKDSHDKTPLFKAIEMQSLVCVRLLVNAGAKARVTCRDERNALEYAITEYGDECFSIIEYLYCARGIRDVDMETRHMTLLHQATVAKRHVSVEKVIKLIFESGAEREPMEGNLRTPLILATMQERPDIVYTLLSLDCDMNHYDTFTKNAIGYAKRDSECFKVLMGAYDDPEGGERILEYSPFNEHDKVGDANIDQHEVQQSVRSIQI